MRGARVLSPCAGVPRVYVQLASRPLASLLRRSDLVNRASVITRADQRVPFLTLAPPVANDRGGMMTSSRYPAWMTAIGSVEGLSLERPATGEMSRFRSFAPRLSNCKI